MLFCSTVVDKPHASYSPWPSTHQQGGGAVIPCVYKISISTCVATEIIKHLKTLEGDKENRLDGYQLIDVQVNYNGKQFKLKKNLDFCG